MTKPQTSEPAAGERTTATPEAAPVRARVIRDFWWKHRNGTSHTTYRAGQIVIGTDAEELLATSPHVVPDGAEAGFRLCPGVSCGAMVPVEVIRAGAIVAEDAWEAVVAIHLMIDTVFVKLRPG